MHSDEPWADNDEPRHWDFADLAPDDSGCAELGYEAAMPGLQHLYAREAPGGNKPPS